MRIAFLGLGLIGGSIARALAARPDSEWRMAAWTPQGAGPRAAVDAGVIELAAGDPEAALDGADLVVLAAPPLETLELVRRLAGPLRASIAPGAVITDVASTKAAIVAEARGLGVRFVGGHPMAGRETAGFGAADATLFADRPWVVVPSDDAAAVGRVAALAMACGSRVVHLSAEQHDRAVAAISHVPLVVSAALVEAIAAGPGWSDAAPLAAGGWASMTRLARGDVAMGTGIATTNATAIAAGLREVRAAIDRWLADLEHDGGPDQAALRARLASARSTLVGEEA